MLLDDDGVSGLSDEELVAEREKLIKSLKEYQGD